MPFRLGNAARNRTVGLCVEKAWEVVFACDNGHGGRFGAAELARFAPETTLEQIAERLVCSTCGARSGSLDIRQDAAALRDRDVARYEAEVNAGEKD